MKHAVVLLAFVGCEPAHAVMAEPTPAPPATSASRAAPAVSDASLEGRFAPPRGFERVALDDGSFGAFLRKLRLRPPGTPVRSYTGRQVRAADDPGVAAVVELDVGERDLQQCADAVMRLHAEWLLPQRPDEVRYPLSSGQWLEWSRWAAGERARVEGERIVLSMSARPDDSRQTFRQYLDFVFGYAGTGSLAKYATPVARDDITPGDFFVLPGNPGHTVLVLDLARDRNGRTVALLGQSFMPAQDFHVLRKSDSVWFSLDGDAVRTPFWPAPFPWTSLRRW